MATVATLDAFTSVGRSRPGWIVAAAALLIISSFWVGWLIAPVQSTPAGDQFQIRTETTAAAVPETSRILHASPADAALAAALAQAPDLEGAQVTRIVGIYADDATVDLRVQVEQATSATGTW